MCDLGRNSAGRISVPRRSGRGSDDWRACSEHAPPWPEGSAGRRWGRGEGRKIGFCRRMCDLFPKFDSTPTIHGENRNEEAAASAPDADGTTLPENYEAALAELEGLVARMEGGALSLEESLAAYRRGAALVGFCQQQLEKVEQQVRVLDGETLKAAARRRAARDQGGPTATTGTIYDIRTMDARKSRPRRDGTGTLSAGHRHRAGEAA